MREILYFLCSYIDRTFIIRHYLHSLSDIFCINLIVHRYKLLAIKQNLTTLFLNVVLLFFVMIKLNIFF